MLPDEQVSAVGAGRKTFPVRVRVMGLTMPLPLARVGGESVIGLARAAREQAGLSIGSAYPVEITADLKPRSVEMPEAATASPI